MERGILGTIFILIFIQIIKLMAPSSLINILMAPASSLMYAGSGTISRIHKLTDFKRLRFHKNAPLPHHQVTKLIS